MDFRKHGKAFLVALIFVVVLDLISLTVRPLLTQLQRLNESISYGLSSVSASSILSLFFARLQGERYHPYVLSVRNPFNLSEACRQGQPLDLCLTSVSSSIGKTPFHDFTESFGQATVGPGPVVDEQKYPRSKAETLFGVPDAALHTFVCAWRGREGCRGPAFTGAEVRSNWFGKLLLLLAVGLTVGATIAEVTEARSKFARVNKSVLAVVLLPLRFLMAVFIVGIASLVALIVLTVFTHMGLLLSSVVFSLTAFLPTKWLLDAIKDLAVDKLKKPILGED